MINGSKLFIHNLNIFLIESMLKESKMTLSKDHERNSIEIFEHLYQDIGED